MVKRDPVQYAQSSSAQVAWAKEIVEKLNLTGNEHILDLGCGDGKVTVELLRHVPSGSVTGMDSSAEMIRYAKETYPLELYPGLSFIQADARTFAVDRQVHLVFSSAALHWVDDQKSVLKRVYGALLTGGRLIATTGGTGNAAGIIASVTEITKRPLWAPYFAGFEAPYFFRGPEEYFQWLRAARLTPLRVALVEKEMVHKDRAGLAAWVRTTWMPFTERIPEEGREEFIKEVVDRYIDTHPVDETGATHVKMVRLEVEAIKE